MTHPFPSVSLALRDLDTDKAARGDTLSAHPSQKTKLAQHPPPSRLARGIVLASGFLRETPKLRRPLFARKLLRSDLPRGGEPRAKRVTSNEPPCIHSRTEAVFKMRNMAPPRSPHGIVALLFSCLPRAVFSLLSAARFQPPADVRVRSSRFHTSLPPHTGRWKALMEGLIGQRLCRGVSFSFRCLLVAAFCL